MKGLHKDLRKPVKLALERGWSLSQGRGHLKLCKEEKLIIISVSLSDHRAVRNILGDMKRMGAL